MSSPKSTTPPPTYRGLWYYRERDVTVTTLVLAGQTPAAVGRSYGLSTANVIRIVRSTLARLNPEWVDGTGRSLAWSTPLTALRLARQRWPR